MQNPLRRNHLNIHRTSEGTKKYESMAIWQYCRPAGQAMISLRLYGLAQEAWDIRRADSPVTAECQPAWLVSVVPAKPSTSACCCIAARQKATWSGKSMPSSAAPMTMSSRFTPRANALSFIFFRTDETLTSWIDLVGLTKALAVRNPANSSQANKALSRCETRGVLV